jgi:hypothetical protein
MKTDHPFEPASTPGRKPYRFPPGLYHLCVQKADLSHLDVRAEAEALGIEFAAASPSPSGWLPCRAVGRVDRNPSAAINVGSDGRRGLYRDLGDAGGRATSFFDLAVRIGRFPARARAVRHYAKSVKKHACGFFLASCGEVFGSRKKLQGKDLKKQKRCGLLECSCEDVRNSLAGGKQ